MINVKDGVWYDATPVQVRGIFRRNGIDGRLLSVALGRFKDPNWAYGPDLYLIDTNTDKGVRVTVQGPDEFDVKISRRTGTALLDELTDRMPGLVDSIVIMH